MTLEVFNKNDLHQVRIYYFTYNKASEGHFREDYFNKKREVFPQDVDKIPGKDYSKISLNIGITAKTTFSLD